MYSVSNGKGRDITISCPIILKNEGETVYKALESVHGMVDEFIISIDDATIDNTRQEVDRFFKDCNSTPYRVISHKWDDNFSKARNNLIRICRHDYIFIIDGHEWLEGKESINKIKDMNTIDLFIMDIILYGDKVESVMAQPRLFKKKYKYEDAAHNVLIFDQSIDNVLKLNDVKIHHKRSKELFNERMEQRKGMNLKDLRERQKRGDNTANYKLGCELMALGRWDKAIKAFEKYMEKDSPMNERYQMMINLGMCYYRKKDFVNAEKTLKESEKFNIEDRNAHMVFLAELYLIWGDYFRSIYYSTLATGVKVPTQYYILYPGFYYKDPFDIMKKAYSKIGFTRGVKECDKILEKINGNNN
jgi:glycosyltransferase involved in cell wall biosynthesis